MGKVVLTLVSKHADTCYVQAAANSPSFSAVTTFNCPAKALVEFGKRIKGFPKSEDVLEHSMGAGNGKIEFNFKAMDDAGNSECWLRIRGLGDEQGHSPEAYFPIDYLETAFIDHFSQELVKMGTGHGTTAELKNRFEKK
jgi:hypothetical protein